MKTNVRNSKLKRSKKTGFRYRMKTKGGRKVIRNRRRRGRNLSAR
jgi:ribosomal protein L34